MKISKKKRLGILNAIAEAMIETLEDQYPDYARWGPPDTWDSVQRKDFDLVAMFESKAARNVDKVLSS